MINISRYKWAVVVVIAVPMLAYSSYFIYWYAKSVIGERTTTNDAIANEAVKMTPPDELGSGFDPSINTGVYKVTRVWIDEAKVELAYEWPPEQKQNKITPVISCPTWDNKIFDLGARTPRYVSTQKMLEVMQTTPTDQLLFMGLCSDRECQKIERGCTLRITQQKYNE
jgi:hypothetical protein